MITSLKKAYGTYAKLPFNFVWASALYLVFLMLFLFASLALFVIYFMLASVLGQQAGPESIPTLIALALAVIIFEFFASGLNASLAMSYRGALVKEKTSLAKFYAYALSSAPVMFAIGLIRDFILLIFVLPAAAIYYYVLKEVAFMDILTAGYVLFVMFVLHLLFTPALVAAGAFGMGLMGSLKRAYAFLRNRHVAFAGLYFVFAIVWVFNFMPFINVATIFFLFPVCYAAMIAMMEGGMRLPKEADE